MPTEPPSYTEAERIRGKRMRARNEAVWVVAAGIVLHIAGLVGLAVLPHDWRLLALLLEMFGAIAVFGGLIGLYTYYDRIEGGKYLPHRRAGVGRAMEKS